MSCVKVQASIGYSNSFLKCLIDRRFTATVSYKRRQFVCKLQSNENKWLRKDNSAGSFLEGFSPYVVRLFREFYEVVSGVRRTSYVVTNSFCFNNQEHFRTRGNTFNGSFEVYRLYRGSLEGKPSSFLLLTRPTYLVLSTIFVVDGTWWKYSDPFELCSWYEWILQSNLIVFALSNMTSEWDYFVIDCCRPLKELLISLRVFTLLCGVRSLSPRPLAHTRDKNCKYSGDKSKWSWYSYGILVHLSCLEIVWASSLS